MKPNTLLNTLLLFLILLAACTSSKNENENNNEGVLGFYIGNMINIYRAIPNYCLKFPLNDLYLKSSWEFNQVGTDTETSSGTSTNS